VGAGGADAGTDSPGDEPPACLAASACVQQPIAGQECVTTMHATMRDTLGSPVAELPVFVCGTNLCSEPVKTAADGTVDLAVCLPFAGPALKVFSDPAYVPFAALLTGAGPSFSVGGVTIVRLPGTGSPLASGSGTVSSGPVSLTLDATTVTFDVEHTTPDAQLFRAAPVAANQLPGSLAGGVTSAWGLAPLNTTLVPPAQLTLSNDPKWPAGAAVDVYANGTDPATAASAPPWGAWGLLGTGAVTSDGASIVLTSAQGGLPVIAMVGAKLH
jgi:hypothetical protein